KLGPSVPTTLAHRGGPHMVIAGSPASEFTQLIAAQSATASAHESYLRFTRRLSDVLAGQVSAAAELSRSMAPEAASCCDNHPGQVFAGTTTSVLGRSNRSLSLDRRQCLEFAVGSIAAVLGPAYAEVDSFPTRVRLPDEPLMLADRIVSVHGESLSLTAGRVITEHDVHAGSWYLDGGLIPACIAIEAGQADLFLAAYLGIDFHTRGLAVYRLLDACVTFHGDLPGPGEVIQYEIRIEHFFRQGDTYLFRFSFE